jgi:hypothetical protein
MKIPFRLEDHSKEDRTDKTERPHLSASPLTMSVMRVNLAYVYLPPIPPKQLIFQREE